MLSIGSVSSSASQVTQLLSTGETSRTELTEEQKAEFEAARELQLDQGLAEAGVDEETAESLKSDLQTALDSVFSSAEGQPDPEAVRDAVDSVFEEYGLDASEIMGAPPTGGPPPGGPPPGGPPPSDSSDSADSTTESSLLSSTTEQDDDLLSFISMLSSEETDSASMAQLMVDAYYGIDETV